MRSFVPPMLLAAGAPRTTAGWIAQPKLDGWRAQVHVTRDGVSVWTRHGNRVDVPEFDHLTVKHGARGVLLDGELVVLAGCVWRSDDFVVTAYRETCGFLDAAFIARNNEGTIERCGTVETFSRGGSPRLLHELLERAAGAPSRRGWRAVPPILHVTVQHRIEPSGDVREPLVVGVKPG